MSKFIVGYSSNNSGGGWWLTDKNWKDLEKNGWNVIWGGYTFCHSETTYNSHKDYKGTLCKSSDSCRGHAKYSSAKRVGGDRWLGCLAKYAELEVDAKTEDDALKIAIDSFEKITGQDSDDSGCDCCGSPHYFSTK